MPLFKLKFQTMQATKRRTKKTIPAMLPEKKWLSRDEAMAFTSLSINNFDEVVRKNKLTVSAIGSKRYYRVSQLNELFENNIIVNQY